MEKYTMLKPSSQNWKQTERTMLVVKFFYCQSKEMVHSTEHSVRLIHFYFVLPMRIVLFQIHILINLAKFFALSIGNCTGNVRLQFGTKDGTNLVQIKKFSIKIKVGKGSLKLSNLFNGDKVLGECRSIEHMKIDVY